MKNRKHNYTCELELKSLLIRVKNWIEKNNKEFLNTKENITKNRIINKYISYFVGIDSKEYDNLSIQKKNKVKQDLKKQIIKLSEETICDVDSYNRFGTIILLMVKNILKKPQFSGYTYRDDFYSDAVYKILKYIGNFDHTKISKISEQPVNAFAYISQIIHNSILYIININKKIIDEQKKEYDKQKIMQNIAKNSFFNDYKQPLVEKCELYKTFKEENLIEEVNKFLENLDFSKYSKIVINYPNDYVYNIDDLFDMESLKKLHKHIEFKRLDF